MRKISSIIILIALVSGTVWLWIQQPSHDRIWERGQDTLPRIMRDGDTVTIHNYRDFHWTSPEEETPTNYTTKTLDYSLLETVDIFISHFDDFEGIAHIFVSFGFSDGEHVVISLETRREVGEAFSPLLGILRQFEIIYVVGSEPDIVGLRTHTRGERVYLYPTIASKEKSQALFDALTAEVNAIYHTPRTYNTLLRNCTNEITRQVERISSVKFPLTWKTVLPGYFDEVLYDMNLIQHNDSYSDFETFKESHRISIDTNKELHRETFSKDLRDTINIK